MNIPTLFRTRADLALSVPAAGIMIELGVARGDFAVALMRANREARYYGVDRYIDRGHDFRQYRAAYDRIDALGGCLIRDSFAAARERFISGEAALVYVDGYAHTGQDGGRTLRDWWPIVAPGGIMAGHDYCERWQPTMDAVAAFVAEHGMELHVIEEEPYPSWWVQRAL